MGASIGSFLNALADRIYLHDVTLTGRSRCLSCQKELKFYELFPVLSYLVQRGKCRNCGAHIPYNLFFSELIGGVLFVMVFFKSFPLFGFSSLFYPYFLFLLLIVSCFLFIAIYDWKFFIIPDLLVYSLTGLTAVLLFIIFMSNLLGFKYFAYSNYNMFLIQHILSAILLFIFFFAVYFFTKGRGIGGGDVKLSFLIGLLLGAKPSIIFLYAAFFSGAIVSSILLITKSKGLKDAIPFGPFLSFGVIVALLYSGYLLQTPLFNFINYFSALI